MRKHLSSSDKILAAVSGGVDSMVLIHLMQKADLKFEVAHCNFQLRGKDADQDESFVGHWCADHHIRFHSKRFDLDKSKSIQLEAREVRYKWFYKLLATEDLDTVATAHHLNDSLETHLLNLSRGSGIKGFAGIPATGKSVIRPLAFVSKQEILSYADQNDINRREDRSNQESDYHRNFIRNRIIPTLQELNPSLLNTYKQTQERLRLANEVLQLKVKEVSSLIKEENGALILPLAWLSKESDKLILSELLRNYGFNYVTTTEIFEARKESGKIFHSADHRLVIDRKQILITPYKPKQPQEFTIEYPGIFQIEHLTIRITEAQESRIDTDANTETFDAKKLVFPLTIRPWKRGDRFRPLGMQGTMLISDFLINRKISIPEKEQTLVLLSGNKIAWMPGHRISEDFKIQKRTSKFIKVQITR